MNAYSLEPCPLCLGPVAFHSDKNCSGCHLIECPKCRAFFDFVPSPEPGNSGETVDLLRYVIAHLWNKWATAGCREGAPTSPPGTVPVVRLTHLSVTECAQGGGIGGP
jgi:hypothetical protein